MEKYKELYSYATDVFVKEHDRFVRADEKANRFSVIAVFLIGVNAFFAKTVIDSALPPRGCLEWLLVGATAAALALSASGWYVSNSVFRLRVPRSRPLNQQMLDFFRLNTLLNVYYAMAVRTTAAYEENVRITDSKYKRVRRADTILRFAVAATLAVSVLYALRRYLIAVEDRFYNMA